MKTKITDKKISHLNIICYKWGTKYGADYVNILHAMVKRNLSVPHTFHCITDDPTALQEDIIDHPLPDYGVEGIWRKLATFQKDFLGLEGQYVVSIDLDVVIVGNLDFLADRPEESFLIARNWSRKTGGARGSGSIYRLKVGSHAFIWDRFIADQENAVDRYHGKNRDIGEQNWLNANIETFRYFPEGKVVSFKRHCHAKGHYLFGKIGACLDLSTACWGKATLPKDAVVVSFHGDPLPPDVMFKRSGQWRHAPFVKQHWTT